MSLRAVSIAGVGCTPFGAHPDTPIHELAVRAARAAIDEAGLARADIGSLYLGNFIGGMLTGQEVLAGLMPRGHGGGWSLEGRTGMDGELPINASGGLLAKGHPVGATGLSQIYEAVSQLRGTHPNQVQGAAIGRTHNLGGTGIACTVNILARPDA